MQRNRLGEEKSPYLLQHKDNPVWWQPWDDAAFEEARRRDVPVFLSVGYSTCHWCHVMEHESFEDPAVAQALNEHFVAIKVDREERPDVDALYMDAVQAMTGRGGWPMSVFMTPDGRPFATGTYFPKPHFLQILENVAGAWESERDKVVEQAQAVANALAQTALQERAGGLTHAPLVRFGELWKKVHDPVHGGRQGAPKFPPAWDVQLLLRLWRRGGDEELKTIARTTLDRMAASGTYDHLGGGFHRYATDNEWLVPHFEKMLYDQASLVRAYVDAWRALDVEEYRLVARETLDYVLRDLTDEEGGFYSAEDADSEGVEGKFYVWSRGELTGALDEAQLGAFESAFTISESGNFEGGTNILALRPGASRTDRPGAVASAMQTLFEVREKRVRPHLDDKILADWNGLMIAAMARAGRLMGEPRYVEGAARAARFVLERMRDDEGKLLHRHRDGEAAIRGFLDDYAFVTEGLLELYQATLDRAWLDEARALVRTQDALFFDEEHQDWFATDGADETLLVRRVEPLDNVVPAGRSVAIENAQRLGALLADDTLTRRASAGLASSPKLVVDHPTAFARLLATVDRALDRAKEIAIVLPPGGDDSGLEAIRAALDERFLPNADVVAGPGGEGAGLPLLAERSAKEGSATAYVCEAGVCQAPTTDPREAAEQATTRAPLVPSGG
jgi:hypothetical protein